MAIDSQHSTWRQRVRLMSMPATLCVTMLAGGVACSASALGNDGDLPPDVRDPASVQTPAGAVAFYRGVLKTFAAKFDAYITVSGVLTDELASLPLPVFRTNSFTDTDSRQDLSALAVMKDSSTSQYIAWNRVRGQAREARGFLKMYAPDSSAALTGHLYALEAYAELLLADLFCSGIPLSTVDFHGDYTVTSGSTTAQVYAHAVALFDSALALSGDSAAFQYMAAVGRGRALLNQARYTEAATAVMGVPNEYAYTVTHSSSTRALYRFSQEYNLGLGSTVAPGTPSMADREGVNGLDYRSSGDPRTPSRFLGKDSRQNDMYFPAKYRVSPSITIIVADGIEARLIEVEGALWSGSPDWLVKLNLLRTDGTFETQSDANDSTITDTLWHAGTGGVAGLAPLSDPGTSSGRIDLLFRERAFWLYLTGHRQGDLRRLIRDYDRSPDAVYPTGPYMGGVGTYGGQIVVPVPASERELNPKYHGCFHAGA